MGTKLGEQGKAIMSKELKFKEFDAEVLSVGKANGITFTKKDLEGIIAAFGELKDTIKPPAKLGHNDAQMKRILRDGQPALGWVDSLRLVGNKIMATFIQVPEIVKKSIEAGSLKRVSCELLKNFESNGKKHKWVLSAVALLGADIPAVKDLADLDAFLNQSTEGLEIIDSGSFGEIVTFTFNVNENNEIIEEVIDMDAVEKLTSQVTKLTEDMAKLSTEKTAESAKVLDLQAKLDEAKNEKVKLAQETASEDLKAFCETQVEAFKMTPAAREVIIKGLDADTVKFSEDSAEVSIPLTVFKDFMDKQVEIVELKEKGKEKDKDDDTDESGLNFHDAGVKLTEIAKKIETKDKIDFSDAFIQAMEDNPDMADSYNRKPKVESREDA